MYKKIICFFICTILLVNCSCSTYDEQESHGVTVELFMHPNAGGAAGKRCIYNTEKNCIEIVGEKNVTDGLLDSFQYNPEWLKLIDTANLGQLNDYLSFDNIGIFIFWNWQNGYKNTVVIVEGSKVKTIELPDYENPPTFQHYRDGKLYLCCATSWNKNPVTRDAEIIVVDLKTTKVEFKTITLYNDELEKVFSLSENSGYDITTREYSENYSRPSFSVDENNIIFCGNDGATYYKNNIKYEANNFIIRKYDTTTEQMAAMKVIKNEKAGGFFITDKGYSTVSYTLEENEYGVKILVDKVFYTEYTKELEIIKKTEIQCDILKGNVTTSYGYYDGKLYMAPSVSISQMNGSNENYVVIYDVESGKITQSSNAVCGLRSGFNVIEKKNGIVNYVIDN